MKVVQVVPAVFDEASGPSYSVPRLSRALVQAGLEVVVHTVALGPTPASLSDLALYAHPCRRGRLARRLAQSPALRDALRVEARTARLMHNHSLWVMPNVYPGTAVRGTSCRLVTSPRGVFDPYIRGRARFRKRVLWWLGQRHTVERTDCFHATAESELHSIRDAGFRAPVAVVPNGIDIPPPRPGNAPAGRRRLLFLGRLHPKKGVDELLRAWGAVASRFFDWELHVAGPDERGYGGQMRRLAKDLRLARVTFDGPVYRDEKLRLLWSASLFVLPTHGENFGIAVAESLAAGVPAIVTRGAPWDGLLRERCGDWIDHGLDPLVASLERAMATPDDELRAMGARGRAWMERDFSWPGIGRRMAAVYRWLVEGGAPPPTVRPSA